jgi:hypothetical protein
MQTGRKKLCFYCCGITVFKKMTNWTQYRKGFRAYVVGEHISKIHMDNIANCVYYPKQTSNINYI